MFLLPKAPQNYLYGRLGGILFYLHREERRIGLFIYFFSTPSTPEELV